MRTEYEGREDNFTFVEASELHALASRGLGEKDRFSGDWYGGMNAAQAKRALLTGDESLVARSDTILAQLEDKLPVTRRKQWQRVVAGQIVHVPEYLTGNPQCMRRRTRIETPSAPVTIFMDLTSSAMVNADDLLRRGVAILALARVLCQHRAVELWAGVALGENNRSGAKPWSSTLAWRIDTAPLDLARAAFLLAHPAVARGIGYGLAPSAGGHKSWDGNWPFGDQRLHVRTQQDRMRAAMGAAEMLVIPPIYGTDPLVKDPVGWITRELDRLLGNGAEVGSEEWNKEQV